MKSEQLNPLNPISVLLYIIKIEINTYAFLGFRVIIIKNARHFWMKLRSVLAPLERFELSTIGLEVRCSVQLSYRGKLLMNSINSSVKILPLLFMFLFSLLRIGIGIK